MISTAKIFRTGASQAVRLPKEFRFDTDEVAIKRVGTMVLLFPKDAAWDLMAKAIGKADADFMVARDQPASPGKRRFLAAKRRKTS